MRRKKIVKRERQVRCITLEMELQRQMGSYTDLVLLNALVDEHFGSIRALAKAAGISERTLNRRMAGKSQFKFDEILRLAYVFSMTDEEPHEIFFVRYLAA